MKKYDWKFKKLLFRERVAVGWMPFKSWEKQGATLKSYLFSYMKYYSYFDKKGLLTATNRCFQITVLGFSISIILQF